MKKRHIPEQIVRKLRQAEAELARETLRKRGDFPPLEKPLWRHEVRRDEALEGVGV